MDGVGKAGESKSAGFTPVTGETAKSDGPAFVNQTSRPDNTDRSVARAPRTREQMRKDPVRQQIFQALQQWHDPEAVSDAKVEELIGSGLTMLVVAVDGVSGHTYGRYRVGGKWELVEQNMRRIAAAKKQAGQQLPHLLMQYICFEHNQKERSTVKGYVMGIGFDQLIFITGLIKSWDRRDAAYPVGEPRPSRALPHCPWPFFSTMVNSDGSVVPCCKHRMYDNYTDRDRQRRMGTIEETSLAEVYASPAYRATRALVADPCTGRSSAGQFCDGCAVIATSVKLGRAAQPASL